VETEWEKGESDSLKVKPRPIHHSAHARGDGTSDQGNQVALHIVSGLAAEYLMMDLKIP
jgi:hypothetical protein